MDHDIVFKHFEELAQNTNLRNRIKGLFNAVRRLLCRNALISLRIEQFFTLASGRLSPPLSMIPPNHKYKHSLRMSTPFSIASKDSLRA